MRESWEKIRSAVRRAVAGITAAAVLAAGGSAAFAEVSLEEKGLELAGSSLHYPVLTGMEDEVLQKAVNDRILEDTEIREYTTRMSQLLSGGSMTVEWTGGILGDVFSCAVSASGNLTDSRREHRWTGSNIDLRDSREILLDDLFSDPEAGRAALEAYLEEEVLPELSAHLLNCELTPLPEAFFLEREGLTLLYPMEKLTTLKDRAGDIRISWNEIREVLNTREDGILSRIGAVSMMEADEQSGERIRAMASQGCLEGIPAKIGDRLKPLTDRWSLLTDPDVFLGGRCFAPDGGCFRSVLLMTDYISESWDDSVVQGIRADRGCWEGLCIGETSREAWQAILGEPDNTAAFDGEKAEAYRTVPGISDYYRCGDYILQLHADEAGVLASLILTE